MQLNAHVAVRSVKLSLNKIECHFGCSDPMNSFSDDVCIHDIRADLTTVLAIERFLICDVLPRPALTAL